MKIEQPNYIRTIDDIRINEEHWTQKISLIEFNDKNIPGTPQKGRICWTRNYETIPHYQRYTAIKKWYSDENNNFLKYSCKIVKNEVGEIELYTRNSFGEPAEIYWDQQDIIRKIKKKLAEQIRIDDDVLYASLTGGDDSDDEREIKRDDDEDIIKFPSEEYEPEAETTSESSKPKPNKGKSKAKQYQEQPEKAEENPDKEKEKILKDYRANLKKLGKNTKPEEFINSIHNHIYPEELAELEELQTKKDGLGSNQVQKTYDLGRTDLAILWRRQLYFIVDFAYVNNYKMYVWIRLRRCKLGLYYWNWQRGGGRAVIEQAPPNLINESQPNEDGTPKKLMESSRMHYEFCGELGIKRIYQSEFSTYQPRFALFEAIGGETRNPTYAQKKERLEGGTEETMKIPTDIYLAQVPDTIGMINKALGGDTTNQIADLLKLPFLLAGATIKTLGKTIGKLLAKIATLGLASDEIDEAFADNDKSIEIKLKKILNNIMGTKVYLTIGPREHTDTKKSAFYSKQEKFREIIFKETKGKWTTENEIKAGRTYKRWFKEQPHLWDHTTFQFYLFNNITMMANGQFLGIEYEKDTDQFILPYLLFVNHAPGVLMYRWEFKYITVKCEIKCVGTFQDNFNLARVITSFSIIGCGLGLNASGVNVNSLKAGEETKDATNPVADQQGDRMFKSTMFDTLNKGIEPAMFSGNTIDFHYSLAEFFCRLTEPLFFYRVELSELLYNNLNWCNNKCKILYLPLEWETLIDWTQGKKDEEKGTDTRKLGYWKWRGVKLDNDIDGFFTDIMNVGYWLDGGEERKNPKLSYQRQEGYVKSGGNEWDTFEAEETYIEKEIIEKGEEKVASGQTGNVGYAHSTFLRATVPSQTQLLLTQLKPKHPDPSPTHGWCWGCFSHTINTHGGQGTEEIIDGKFCPTEDTGIEFFLMKNNVVDRQVAECKAGTEYTVILRRTGTTIDIYFEFYGKRIIRESVFKEKKTTTQNIDEDALENEYDLEEEIIENEELNENDYEAEEANEGEGNQSERDKEKEREREQEKEEEDEKEKEGEKEDETEQEDESEKEKEKEREKEKEKEREKEKEKEEESETESESETEDEGEGEEEA